MAADERPEAQAEQKLHRLATDLELDEDGVDASMEADTSFSNSPAVSWPGAKQTPWPSKSAVLEEEQKGTAYDDEDSTTGRMTVDELEHELAVERTKRREVSLELQESARVGQMLLERNEELEHEVLNLQQRLEASRNEAAKDNDGETAGKMAEVEWQLQQSARVGQMLLDRNEELEKEVQTLRKQAEANRAKHDRGSEDCDSEGSGFGGHATSSSRARVASEGSSRLESKPTDFSDGSCTSESDANSDGGAQGDPEALRARNEYLEAENERLREQCHEATHRKHGRRRVSTGMFNDIEFGHQRTETVGGDEEVTECFRIGRRRHTDGDDNPGTASVEAQDVIQGYSSGRGRAMTEVEALPMGPTTDAALHEHLQEAIEQNQVLTEECQRLEAIVREQLGRERELTDLLTQERAAAEWAAKEAAREVHGARQAGLDAGLEVVREQRRRSMEQESERRLSESTRANSSTGLGELPSPRDAADVEDASDSEAVAELRERIDELEVKYNEAKHQAWEAHQDMMDLRGLLSAAQVNCQDLEDMAAEKQFALEEEQRRNSSLSEQIQELRHMLEDQRRRQSVLMMCKHAASDASEESSQGGSNNREGTFLDLVHLHRLASRSLPLSVASSRRGSRAVSRQGSRDSLGSRDSIGSIGADSIRTEKSLGCGRIGLRDKVFVAPSQKEAEKIKQPSKSLERTGPVRRRLSPRSRLLEDRAPAPAPESSLTLNSLLRMEGSRISERPEEEDRASSVKDQSAASCEASSEKKDLETSRNSDAQDLESRDSSDDAASSGSSSAGNRQKTSLDPDVEDFQQQSRALLQALLTVTREKPAGTKQRGRNSEARAAKVRQLFLSDIAEMGGARRDVGEDVGGNREPKRSSTLSRMLQARWQKTFAKEVAALEDPSQAGEQPPSLRRTSLELDEHGIDASMEGCTDERPPVVQTTSAPEGTSSLPQAGRLRSITEMSSEDSPVRKSSSLPDSPLRRQHANSADCAFFSIASDGHEDYKRKPTEMLDAFLEGVEFPEEAKRHSEPPVSLSEASGMKMQSDADASKAAGRTRLSWMHRAGWRREGNGQEAAASTSPAPLSPTKETSVEVPAMDRRKKWGFRPSRLFKSTSRASASTAVAQPQDPVAASNSEPGAAKEAENLISATSSSDAGSSCLPHPDKAASPSATTPGDSPSGQGRSSMWSFSWGGGQARSRKEKENDRRLKTLRIAVGGSLDEGSPLAFDEKTPLDIDDTEARDDAAGEGSASPAKSSSCKALVTILEAEEARRVSSTGGQCRNCGQPVEYCECDLDVGISRPHSPGEVSMADEEEQEPSEQCGLCANCGEPVEYCDCRWDALRSATEGCPASPAGKPDVAASSLPSAETGEHRTFWFQMDSGPAFEETMVESGQTVSHAADVPVVDLAQEGEEPSKPSAQRKRSLSTWMEGGEDDLDLSF